MCVLLTEEIAARALMLATPTINALLAADETKRSAMFVVILNAEGERISWQNYGEEAMNAWEHPYDRIAKAKAKLAFREKMNTGRIIRTRLELLKRGDPIFAGGVYRHGFVVGASGVQDYFDEAIAVMVAGLCEALCRHTLATSDVCFVNELTKA